MTVAYDSEGHPVKIEYDMLGRKTSLESLDSGRLEGTMPLGVDGNLGFLPASLAVFTDDDGFAGGSISFGPGMGLSSSTQKSATLSINSVMNFFNRKRK